MSEAGATVESLQPQRRERHPELVRQGLVLTGA